MKPNKPPPPNTPSGLRALPRQATPSTDLGAEERSRARHVFHNATGGPLPFDAVDEFFGYINPWSVVRYRAWPKNRTHSLRMSRRSV